MHLKKFKDFLVFAGQKHISGTHRATNEQAGALTGSINIFQSTIITVYEVEHQKTVNTKLGKQTMRFSEVIKDFYHYFQEKEAESHKKIEIKVALLP